MIEIEIMWDCNYDFKANCQAKYKFNRMDASFKEESAATGFNFRYADKFRHNDTELRYLVKAYGINILINVHGRAGRFNIIPLMMTIGSGIGLMSFSTLLAEVAMYSFNYIKPERLSYRL
jgi:hypothetical protein